MDWLSQNWFWLVVALLFVVMHLGHGGHGGHGPARRPSEEDPGRNREPDESGRRTGHSH